MRLLFLNGRPMIENGYSNIYLDTFTTPIAEIFCLAMCEAQTLYPHKLM